MNTPKILIFNNSYKKEYKNFCIKNFGISCYQKKDSFIKWMFEENPYSRDYSNFLLAILNSKIVGCIHLMPLKYRININDTKKEFKIPTLSNLMIDKDYRKGEGFIILQHVFSTNKSFFIPGAIGKISQTYKNLNFTKIESYWYYKIIYVNFYKLLKIFFSNKLNISALYKTVNKLKTEKINIFTQYNSEIYKSIKYFTNDEKIFPEINDVFLKWRLFHKNGPVNIVLKMKENNSILILSVGFRKKIPITRIFFSRYETLSDYDSLLNLAFFISKKIGSLITLIVSNVEMNIDLKSKYKIKNKDPMPDSWLRSNDIKGKNFINWELTSDIGFDYFR